MSLQVVFTVLDALPDRHVGPDHTPVLDALARSGGRAAGGGRGVMTSSTYPNHATFATGTGPEHHGIVSNWVPTPGRVVPAWKLGPAVPTLFDACTAADRTVAGVFGDQHLVGVMGAAAATRHWPPDGKVPDQARLDAKGYLDDRDTLTALVDAIDATPDLVVSQLNGPDTAAHVFGPDTEEALAGYRATDALLAEIREHLSWEDTVWILVSDHDQETVVVREPVQLQPEIDRRGLALFALPDGAATLVCGEGADETRTWLDDVDGVEGSAPFELASGLECRLAWTTPGRAFGHTPDPTDPGAHGGPRTRAQVAVVAGGHPRVAALARAVEQGPVHAADWAPTIATLLGVPLPSATGRALTG